MPLGTDPGRSVDGHAFVSPCASERSADRSVRHVLQNYEHSLCCRYARAVQVFAAQIFSTKGVTLLGLSKARALRETSLMQVVTRHYFGQPVTELNAVRRCIVQCLFLVVLRGYEYECTQAQRKKLASQVLALEHAAPSDTAWSSLRTLADDLFHLPCVAV